MAQFLTSRWVLWCLGVGVAIVYVLPRLLGALRTKLVEAGDPAGYAMETLLHRLPKGGKPAI